MLSAFRSAKAIKATSDGHNPERMYFLDPTGHVTLGLRRGESQTLYIVPSEGSFASVHVAATDSADSNPVRVVVPAPAGSLRVHLVDGEGKPARAAVGVRFNGEIVPNSVVSRLPRPPRFDVGYVQLQQLPAGAYEIWPASLLDYTLAGVPKSVGLTCGETQVELVVTP